MLYIYIYICPLYPNQLAMCVDPCFHLWHQHRQEKEAVCRLNQGVINLVLKLKAHLIPLILRVTLDILNIF